MDQKTNTKMRDHGRTRSAGRGRRQAAPPRNAPARLAPERRPRKAAIAAWEEPDRPPRRRRHRDTIFSTALRTVGKNLQRVRRRWYHIVREERRHNFPESDRLPVMLILFLWNLLPMAGSLLREQILGKRRKRAQREGRRSRQLHPAVFLGVGCAVTGLILFCSIYTLGTVVTYDGEEIGRLASKNAAEAARTTLERTITRTLGETYTVDDDLIQYSTKFLKRQELMDQKSYQEDLSSRIGLVASAYCLYVDGERIGATPYQGALEELLKQIKTSVSDEDTVSCEIAEKTEIRREYVPAGEVMNLGHLAETLYSTKTAELTYEVKKGDTWSEIAEDNGMTSKELLALNPGYDIDKLQIGEVLTISASVPYLTMTVVQRERHVEDLMYDIQYTDSANLFKGDEKVTSAGQFGAADVLATVTYVNGVETERTTLSSVTLKNPVTEQRLRGTKERPSWTPTGSFRWPCSGRLTSRFGGRRSPGGIGSTNHKGIDIAVPYGTAICAADGGTVIYAGWMSGYGYLVQIDHGNGYVTYYGHNSSLVVSVGSHVYKGQQIARAGSTGNSTGNHCHFEVRYNGVARNPLNYL